jgi:hypothetical protein
MKLPKAEQEAAQWQTAAEVLLQDCFRRDSRMPARTPPSSLVSDQPMAAPAILTTMIEDRNIYLRPRTRP